jgi:hypothetical protein
MSERNPSEIARPAASSAALLIRRPDEIRSTEFERRLLFCPKRFWALIEVMLLKILIGMFIILLDNIMFMNGFRFQHPC